MYKGSENWEPGARNRSSDREGPGGRRRSASQQPFVRLRGSHRPAAVTSVIQTARQWRGHTAGIRRVPPPPRPAGRPRGQSPRLAHGHAHGHAPAPKHVQPRYFSYRGFEVLLPLSQHAQFTGQETDLQIGEDICTKPGGRL